MKAAWLLLAVAGFSLSVVVRPAWAQEGAGAAVEGVVVQRPAGEPVPRATVTLIRAGSGAPPEPGFAGGQRAFRAGPPGSAPPEVTVLTETDGSFRFESVPHGEYLIQVRKPGMFSGRRGSGRTPPRIRVTAGAPVRGLRLELIPQAVIAGRVLDEAGEPVQGARVNALRRVFTHMDSRIIESATPATTDDRGEFRLTGLHPGWYLVGATVTVAALAQGGNRTRLEAPVFYPDAMGPDAAQLVQVAAGQVVSGIEIRCRPIPARRVSGRVLHADGSPAQGFVILPRPVLPGGLYGALSGARAHTSSGSFAIGGLPPGRYHLLARSPETSSIAAEQALMGVAEADLQSGDVDGVEIRLYPPPVLRGRVLVEGPGAEDAARHLGHTSLQAYPLTGPPDVASGPVMADGSFELKLPAPGKYWLHLTGPVLAQAYPSGIRTSTGIADSREVNVTDGRDFITMILRTDGAGITVHRPAKDQDCPSVSAVLMDPSGRLGRPPFLLVRLEREYPGLLMAVPPGNYRLAAYCTEAEMDQTDRSLYDWLLERGEPLRVAAGEQKEFTVRALPLPGY